MTHDRPSIHPLLAAPTRSLGDDRQASRNSASATRHSRLSGASWARPPWCICPPPARACSDVRRACASSEPSPPSDQTTCPSIDWFSVDVELQQARALRPETCFTAQPATHTSTHLPRMGAPPSRDPAPVQGMSCPAIRRLVRRLASSPFHTRNVAPRVR